MPDILLPDRSQLLLGSVLQVLNDGLVVLHTALVEGGDFVVVSGTGSLGAVEQSVDVLC
jgi:N-acetylglucosamine kinase-like BadF-type ATPase